MPQLLSYFNRCAQQTKPAQPRARTRLPHRVARLRVVGVHVRVRAPARVAVQADLARAAAQRLQRDKDVGVRLALGNGNPVQVRIELRDARGRVSMPGAQPCQRAARAALSARRARGCVSASCARPCQRQACCSSVYAIRCSSAKSVTYMQPSHVAAMLLFLQTRRA